MRIAMVGTRGTPARAGGAERVVEQLSGELTHLGHEVIVYGRAAYVGDAPQAGPVRVIVTAGLGGKHTETITHTATAVFDLLRRGVDVVHIHSPGPALMSWVPAAAAKPIVLTVHAPDWRREKWSLPARVMLKTGLALGMRFADAVTAVSKPLAQDLAETFGRTVHFVPNAPPPVIPASPDLLHRCGLDPEGYALYVGRIEPEKRLDMLLDAWGDVGSGPPLVVVGTLGKSSYDHLCRRKASGRNVLFVGPQYGQDLGALYTHALFLVQPSVLEGMSMVLLEAAAYGKCILAADIPENRQAFGDSILYFNTDESGILGKKIRECVDQEALRVRMGNQARRFAQSAGTWSQIACEMDRIYRSVLR